VENPKQLTIDGFQFLLGLALLATSLGALILLLVLFA
jgi:hypothetical protein